MSSINKYESLKNDGTSVDCLKYILSLSDKSEIEKYLKESLTTSYDDLRMFIFLSKSTKNEKNSFEIFQTDSLPIKQRAIAQKCWIQLQKDEKEIFDFVIKSINDKNLCRYLKHQILKDLHRIDCLKKSSSFFYDLTCRLTETNNHEKYNIDAHLVPFCKKDQIFDILSRWSIKRLEQINSLSPFYSKLIRYQPLIIIHLIKGDLNEKKTNFEQFENYFRDHEKLFNLIYEKEAKEFILLTIEYLNQLKTHKRFLPEIIQSKQKYFFKKSPNEMIQLITIAASNQPGTIKYQSRWGSDGYDLDSFSFPRSFSIENYVNLFITLYDTCKWSSNHIIQICEYMLTNLNQYSNIYSLNKQRKWFYDIVIQQKIGKDLFLKKILKEGNENTLKLLEQYSDLTTPLSLHLISQYERKGVVKAPQRLELIRYQTMTKEIFDQFLSLFKQTGSDVNQRQKNYPLFLQCALYTNEESVKNVLQWIEKRFTNEQLIVIEQFLRQLTTINNRFHLQILPNYFQSIQTIIDIAFNHLQQSINTLQIIIQYGINLLKCSEQHLNKQQKQNIQTFAIKIIKQCYSKNDSLTIHHSEIPESYREARHIIVDIVVSDVFPKLVSKCLITELKNFLTSTSKRTGCWPEIDSFLNEFFTKSLPSSTKLQSSFQIDTHSAIILYYLKNKSTRFERVNQLINQIDKIFFIDEHVQRIALRSQQHRKLIDQLIEDDKSVTLDKLSNEQSKFAANLTSQTKNTKFPGLNIDLLTHFSRLLTGKQQKHITNIILDDYLQDKEVSNLNKLKSLRVLRRLPHTYNQTLGWFEKKKDSQLASKNPNEATSSRTRGAAVQPLDDIIICLPATFDLTPENLLKHFELLKTKLNASNAKYISDAMLNISRKIPDEIFLKHYLEFIRNEQFQKLGITANKEIIRLLNQYASEPNLVEDLIKPLWDNHPHQDVRVCLILTILNFISKSNSNDDQIIIWKILEEAANDEYLPVIQSLFSAGRGQSRWPLTQLKNSSDPLFVTFVNRIQFKVLDHPTSLEARSSAWSSIDYEYADKNKLIEKAQQLCIQFDKDSNTLWETAFQKIISLFKINKISSIDIIINILKKLMSCREEIDSKQNALDNQHDLPVYHRIQRLLTNINSNIDQFDNEKKIHFRLLTPIILQFDKTLAPLIGTLLIKISHNKEDLEDVFKILQENLSENYFERILTEFSTLINKKDSCPFIQLLNVDEKLHLAQWFINEKHRPLFVFDLLKDHVFNQQGVDREQCQNLLKQIRQSENLFLRQQAMEYTVPWNENGSVDNDNDDQMSVSANSDMS